LISLHDDAVTVLGIGQDELLLETVLLARPGYTIRVFVSSPSLGFLASACQKHQQAQDKNDNLSHISTLSDRHVKTTLLDLVLDIATAFVALVT
jgi:hypothetical protein